MTLGIGYENHTNTRTSVIPRVGARVGNGFATVGFGRQWFEFARNGGDQRAQSSVGFAFGERKGAKSGLCPLFRAEQNRGWSDLEGKHNSGTVQIGAAMGRVLSSSNRRTVTFLTEVGLRHGVGLGGPGDQESANAFVLGGGLSVILKRALILDASFVLPITIPGAYEGVLGLGATIGR